VLIVDDDDQVRSVTRRYLEREGYATESARHGEEAMRLVEEQAIDAVLLDVIMPGLDGVEVTRRLKSDPATRGIPIIVMTGAGEHRTRLEALRAGAEDFIDKPFRREELATRLRNLVRLKQASDVLRKHNAQLHGLVEQKNRQILETERFLRAALDAIPAHVVLLDLGGILIGANTTWRSLVDEWAPELDEHGVGTSYYALHAAWFGSRSASLLQERVRAVVAGTDARAHHEASTEVRNDDRRWFRIEGRKLQRGDRVLIVLAHDETTAYHRARQELQEASHRLIEVSRVAGMAAVANGVIHDLGNALTGVTVTVDDLRERIADRHAPRVQRVAQELRERAEQPGDADPIGEIARYLDALSGVLATREESLRAEVENLSQHVDHVTGILRTQQTFAKPVQKTDRVSLDDLVREVLQIEQGRFERSEIHIESELSGTPVVETEKNRVQQIFINLLNNAHDAVRYNNPADGWILVRTAMEGGRVLLEVADNGIGIPAEVQDRLFEHGFTTKKDGHGFGLHSCRRAAADLGGKLTFHSGGLGKGAVFVLSLPGPAIGQAG